MTRNRLSLGLAILLCVGFPALAEMDLSGSWASKNHEDSLERGAGPNPDDWAGLPFNASGRAKALSFSQSIISDAGAHLLVSDAVAYRGRPVQPEDLERKRSAHRENQSHG